MKSIALVVFDWAGTLVDFGSRAPIAALREAFRAAGMPVEESLLRRDMGKSKREHIRAVLLEIQDGACTDEEIDAIYERFLPLQMTCIAQHSEVIPGIPEMVADLRGRGIAIGSSTGYSSEIMKLVEPKAERGGLRVDFLVTASDDCPGRPAPWMIYRNAEHFDVYPMNRVIKVDDTVTGIQAGRNAGCWTVGVAATGNLIGLSESEFIGLGRDDRGRRLEQATDQLSEAGAHFVVDSAAELGRCLSVIEEQSLVGGRP